jgi:pyruvate dehydrogenase E1 component alpha subunit
VEAEAPELSRLADEDLALMMLIRHFELAALELFASGELSGTTHTCLGQEYIPVTLAPLLEPADWVFSNHRGHGHYLARFADPSGLLAELMGRDGAVCAGVGGSQHLRRDRYLSTGIQGESLPLAVGAALWLSRQEPGQLACVYVGDGTWGEGAVYEALNLAALWRLPLLVVVEHNGIAQTTPTERQLAGSIGGRAAGFGVRHVRLESMDVGRLRHHLVPLIAGVRTNPAPVVVEFATVRLGPHSKGDDTRSAAQLQQLRAADWYEGYRRDHPDQFAVRDRQARAAVAAVVDEVARRPLSVW